MTVKLRYALKRNGRLPRHVLSALLVCEQCGASSRCVNGREFGCSTHRDGGNGACPNGIRIAIAKAEHKLLDEVVADMLPPKGAALLERKVRERSRAQALVPKQAPKPQAALIAKKRVTQIRSAP